MDFRCIMMFAPLAMVPPLFANPSLLRNRHKQDISRLQRLILRLIWTCMANAYGKCSVRRGVDDVKRCIFEIIILPI